MLQSIQDFTGFSTSLSPRGEEDPRGEERREGDPRSQARERRRTSLSPRQERKAFLGRRVLAVFKKCSSFVLGERLSKFLLSVHHYRPVPSYRLFQRFT
jgi:hypothetical protein